MTDIIEIAKKPEIDTDYTDNYDEVVFVLNETQLRNIEQQLREEFIKELGEPVGEVKLDEYNLKYIHWNAHHWSHVLYGGTQLYALPKKG